MLFASFLQAQSLKVVDTESVQSGVVGSELRTAIRLQNVSSETIYVRSEKLNNQIGSSQKSFFCIDNDCVDGDIVSVDQLFPIKPNETITVLTSVLETGLVTAVSTVKYRFVNARDTDDFTDFELNYDISERIKEGMLYTSENMELSDVYPNPVSETAIFNYTILDNAKEAKIIIHNVLGSIAGEYVLSAFENRLAVDMESYNPGVYFYTLYLDKEGVATKKLVVRK